MHNLSKPRHVTVLIGLSAMLMLASCAKKEDQTASAPSAAPSAAPSPASPASPATSPLPSVNLDGNAIKQGKTSRFCGGSEIGVKPTDATTCPTNAPVKGNVTKKRGELYFTTKYPDYKTVKPEICFKDTATAEKAGFKLPKAQ